MELAEGAVGLHAADDVVDQLEQVVLPFAHQHTNLSVGEGCVQERCSK